MNDLTTELRRMADEARQARPQSVAEILENGDRMRRRMLARRSAAGLSAAVAVAAVAVTVSAVQPRARETRQSVAQGTHQRAQLTAWTVARQSDGDVSLTVRQFADTARLQKTLRADGVPASVLTEGQANPCQLYGTTGTAGIQNVVTGHSGATPEGSASAATIVTIHPSALPSGAGLQVAASSGFGRPGTTTGSLGFRLVQASQACTGS
jgi:hypothetical protein